MEPVDPHEAPDYYNVVKEPMGDCFYIFFFKFHITCHQFNNTFDLNRFELHW